jgi:UDP-N-acetylglucosamine 2-epimerase
LALRVASILGGRPHPPKASSIDDAFRGANAEHFVIAAAPHSELPRMLRDISYVRLPEPKAIVEFADLTNLFGDLRQALQRTRPDIVITYGDLWPSIAGLVAACAMGLPTVHIEAGYRSGDLSDPQEALRILLDHGSTHCIAFDMTMVNTLMGEGIGRESISVFPNPNVIALSSHLRDLCGDHLSDRAFVHLHHDENLSDARRISYILDQILRTADICSLTLRFLFSPHFAQRIREHGLLAKITDHVRAEVIPEEGYGTYLQALASSSVVFTDSASLQDECSALSIPCIVFRRATPRPPSAYRYLVTEIDSYSWDLVAITEELVRKSGRREVGSCLPPTDARYGTDFATLLANICRNS